MDMQPKHVPLQEESSDDEIEPEPDEWEQAHKNKVAEITRHEEWNRHFMFTPQFNSYRCMSIRIYGGSRAWTKCFTLVVAGIQILGPCFLYGNHRRVLRTNRYESLASHLWSNYENSLTTGNITSSGTPGSGEDQDFFTWAYYDDEATVLIERKILGCLFMLAVFLHVDRSLLDLHAEEINLSRYFPDHIRMWLWLDAFANGINGVVIGFTVSCLFEATDGVLELCKEALSLLFILNLDDIAGGLNFGISDSIFNDVVNRYRKEWWKKTIRDEYDSSDDDEERPSGKCCGMKPLTWFVSLCRAANIALLATQLPMYMVTFQVVEEHPETATGICHSIPSFCQLHDTFGLWWFLCLFVILSLYGGNSYSFFSAEDDRHDLDNIQVEEKDFFGFLSKVLLRCPDVRWQKRVALQVAEADFAKKKKHK